MDKIAQTTADKLAEALRYIAQADTTGLNTITVTAKKALSEYEAEKNCETCEGKGRIEILPDSEYTHPCDDCQPEALREFNRGREAEKTLPDTHTMPDPKYDTRELPKPVRNV